jgi:hypothetical protein
MKQKMIRNAQPSHNRTVYAAPAVGGLGFCSARSFRFAPFPRLTPAQFASPGLASQALIRAGKPSYTAETLCEIPKQNYCKNIRI